MFGLVQHPPHVEIIKSQIVVLINRVFSIDLGFMIFIICCWWLWCVDVEKVEKKFADFKVPPTVVVRFRSG